MLRRFLKSLSSKQAASERKRHPQGLVDDAFDLPPYGQILRLRCAASAAPKANAVFDKLGPYCNGRLPFAGILIDLSQTNYRFSSEDLGGIGAAIAAWVRGWVAPCAIVLTGRAARDLEKLLNLTKLSTTEQIRIVDNVESARRHIERVLENAQSNKRLW